VYHAQRFDYTGLAATGIAASSTGQVKIALPIAARSFAVQVKGVGGVPTAWTVALEGSIDAANWTALITHNAGDGSTQWAADKPVAFVRVNVSALTLGPASAINVGVLALP
jgi:hypothetical protein